LLYNSGRTQLAFDDDGAGSRNFRIVHNLTAGQTYYIGAKCFSTGTGSYTFSITAPVVTAQYATATMVLTDEAFKTSPSETSGSAMSYSDNNVEDSHNFLDFSRLQGNSAEVDTSSGNIVEYTYAEAFSQSVQDLDSNPFRFAGEYIDLETNTYYLRSRYYSPVLGRFMTEDTLRSTSTEMPNGKHIIDSLSLNLYTYCWNNPILYYDPSGNAPTFRQRSDGKRELLHDNKIENVMLSIAGGFMPMFDYVLVEGLDLAVGHRSAHDIYGDVASMLNASLSSIGALKNLAEAGGTLSKVYGAAGTLGNVLSITVFLTKQLVIDHNIMKSLINYLKETMSL